MLRQTILAGAAVLALASCASASEPSADAPTNCVPSVIAHRGEPDVAPEETLPSFTAAIDHGAKTIEGDVQFTRDGRPMMMHDDMVDRTTDGTGAVADQTEAQVESLDAGGWMSNQWKGTRVPTLSQFLALAKDRDVSVIVELKQAGATRTEVKTFLRQVRASGGAVRVTVESFHPENLRLVRQLAPKTHTALITKVAVSPRQAHELGTALLPELSLVTKTRVQAWQQAGVKVYPWTADTTADWAKAKAAGVDGVLTNRTGAYQDWARSQCG